MIEQTPFADETAWSELKTLLRRHAAQQLVRRFHHVRVSYKRDGSPVTEADRAMQQAVAADLARRWPQYGFLGEESECAAQDSALAHRQGCWILDPLDGTTNFAHGFELFAVSLALQVGGEVVLGIVHDPVRDEIFAARRGMGAELDDHPLHIEGGPTRLEESLALVDYKRLPPSVGAALATDPPYASQRNLGTVALDWCWLAAGRADLYLHGGQKLWDYAAGHLVFLEAGGAALTLEGEPIPVPMVRPRSAVAAVTPMLLAAWRRHLAGLMREED